MGGVLTRMNRLGGCLLLACALAASANSLPEQITRDVRGLSVRGEAVMRFFGLKVYDVRLWTPMKPFTYSEPFAVELVYDMALKGKDIAERSVKEMRAQGCSDEAKLPNNTCASGRCQGIQCPLRHRLVPPQNPCASRG